MYEKELFLVQMYMYSDLRIKLNVFLVRIKDCHTLN